MFVPKEMKGGGYSNGRKPSNPGHHIARKPMKSSGKSVKIPWMWIIVWAPLALGILHLIFR
jgi:hypothetical protein